MDSNASIRAFATAQGFRTKRNNLIAAFLSGAVLAFISIVLNSHSAISVGSIVIGILAGFIYANGFEYCLHRFLLHSGRGVFAAQHMVHHNSLRSPDAARYVNFSSNPLGVVALFIANAIPFLILQRIFHFAWMPGAFLSFAVYYAAFEEIHWRSHMGGWLPRWLRPAAKHHLLHHAHHDDRFNVFLPLFDWILESFSGGRARQTEKYRA